MLTSQGTYYILAGIIIYLVIRWIRSRPLPPDPWENLSDNHSHDDVIDIQAKEVPVCTNCFEPINSPRQHYCPKCGNVTGEFTRYIPFVNLQFNYSIIGSMWGKMTNKQTPTTTKVALGIVMLALFPLTLFIGLVVILTKTITRISKK